MSREVISQDHSGVIHCMHNNEKKVQVGKEISVYFNYIKRYFLLEISDKKYLAEMNKI